MSKADTLLKKAAFYEKLALYSDRSAFLKALAQTGVDTTGTQQEDAKNKLGRLNRNLALMASASGLDPQLVTYYAQAANNIKDGMPLNSTLLSYLKDLVTTTQHWLSAHPEPGTVNKTLTDILTDAQALVPSVQTVSHVLEVTNRQPSGTAAIDKKQQDALSKFVTVEGIGMPLKIDGVLGSETRKALDAVKKYFNKPSMSDFQVLQMTDFAVESLPEKYGK
jgi:hypothetical protein